MKTRTTIFEEHSFQKTLDDCKAVSDKIDIKKIPSKEILQNFLRLKKTIDYINNLILATDIDLTPISVWDIFDTHTAKLQTQIESFSTNFDEASLNQANLDADKLLEAISPYVVNGKGAAVAAGIALKGLSKDIELYSKSFEGLRTEIVERTKDSQNASLEILGELKQFREKTLSLEKDFFNNDIADPGIQLRANNLISDLEKNSKAITSYKVSLMGEDGNTESSISAQIEKGQESVLNAKKKVEDELTQFDNLLNDLKTTHTQVFGKIGEDGNITGGLKKEYETNKEKTETYDADQKRIHIELTTQIQKLLNDATTAGLATSYAAQKKNYTKPINTFTLIFYASLIGLFIVALTTLWHQGPEGLQFGPSQTLTEALLGSITRFPFALPFIILAFFASKRRNENRRLQEEYSHKETIAKTYLSFKDQIEKIGGDESKELTAKLLHAAIDTIAFNASKTLDKNHDDNLPSLDQLSNLKKHSERILDIVKET